MQSVSNPKIVILHSDVAPDAGEDEQDCLHQAARIASSLRSLGYEPVTLPFVPDTGKVMADLVSHDPKAVFNLVETVHGHGSMIYFATAILDHLRIDYTGCRTDAMFLTSNKPLAKKMVRDAGLNTPDWITSDGRVFGRSVFAPYILKACWEEASVGLDDDAVFNATHPGSVASALVLREQSLGMPCFAEAYVDGREFNIALLSRPEGVCVLPAAEMLFVDYPQEKLKLLNYRAKWVEDSFEYDHSQRTLDISATDADLIETLRTISLRLWDLFELRGYARVDFRVDKSGTPWILEVNANPCLSQDAGFSAALERACIPFEAAIADILHDALK